MRSVVITKPKSATFAVLDVGTTKVVCIIAKRNVNNSIQVLGLSYKESYGIKGGAIMSVKNASASIISAVEEAERSSGHNIDQIYVSVAGCNVCSRIIEATAFGSSRNISANDVHRMISSSMDRIEDDNVVMHNIPIGYVLDEIDGISNPLGMYGSSLRSNINFVTASKTALFNLQHCITQCPMHMNGVGFSAFASGLSCLDESEMDIGSVILDIGGGTTSIALFRNGSLVYADTVPVGGLHITKDISCAFSVSTDIAERLKNIHGGAVLTSSDVNDYIELDDKDIDARLSRSSLVEIIRPRVEEIMEMSLDKLKGKSFSKMIITGGTSQIHNIKELAGYMMNCQVRLGVPIKLEGIKSAPHPSMSAAIGMVIMVADSFDNPLASSPKKKYLHKIFDWMRMS